jgi:LDH2 family malate/lactate/ureidoglycolate dehydrogenase
VGEVTNERERPYGQWWEHDEGVVPVHISALQAFGVAVLEKAGATADNARYLFESFLEKSLQGDHARGVDKFLPMIRGALAGKVDLDPEIVVKNDRPGSAFLDGGNHAAKGLVCKAGIELAIAKARATGVACVAVRNTSHSLSPMMRQAAEAGAIGLATIASPPLVAPLGGKRALLGNAPIAAGIPAGRNAPVILDMSLTNSSGAGVYLAAQQGTPVPAGAYLDPNGEPETDPSKHMGDVDRMAGLGIAGTLAVVGGGHKGYGLLFVVDLLTRILASADQPWEMEDILEADYGATFFAIDIASFMDLEEAKSRVDEYIEVLRSSDRRNGVTEILYPGEKSQRLREQALARGVVELPISQIANLDIIGRELGIPLDVLV